MSFYADRSERAKLRLGGPQRTWFLHQILTQSLDDIGPGEARDAALITVHGRMVGYLEIVATDDALFAHFEPGLRATLPEAIERYVFATQVTIDDVTDEYGLVLVVSEDWSKAAAEVASDAVAHRTLSLGVPAGYLWVPRGSVEDIAAALAERGFEAATENDLEALRVEFGMARWGKDMDEKTMPPEVGLDDVAVHYDKGCYVGQEAMAKIHFRGKVNRSLRRLVAPQSLEAGADVTLEGQKVGRVTSVHGSRGLGVLRYTVEPGTEVLAGEVPAKVSAL